MAEDPEQVAAVAAYALAFALALVVIGTLALAMYVLYDTRKDRASRRRVKDIAHVLFKLQATRKGMRAYPAMSDDTRAFHLCFLARHFHVEEKIAAFKKDHPDEWKTYFDEYKINERFGGLLAAVGTCTTRFKDDDLVLSESQVAAAATLFRAIEDRAADLSGVFRRIRSLAAGGGPPAAAASNAAFLRRVACHDLVQAGVRSLFDAYVRTYHAGSVAGLAADHVFWISAFETLSRFPDLLPADLFTSPTGLLVAPCRHVSPATLSAATAVVSRLRYYLGSRDLLHLLEILDVEKLAEIYGPAEGDLEAKIRRYHELAGVSNVVVPDTDDLLQAYVYHAFEISSDSIRRVLTYRVGQATVPPAQGVMRAFV